MTLDLVVVGGGPGGYSAALEAAKLGLKTALVEREHLGGTCLNWGCIPTKLLLGGTAAIDELASQAKMRIASGDVNVDLPALQTKKERMLAATRKAILQKLKSAGVEFHEGTGRFVAPDTMEVEGAEDTVQLAFRHCIVATGTTPSYFPGMEPDGDCVLNSDHALGLQETPESLIVVGGGVIGLEMGQIFHRMGAKITVVEALDRLAPWEDPEVSAELGKIYKRKGWKILTGQRVQSLVTQNGQAELTLESGDVLTAAKALVAVGRKPSSGALALDKADVETSGPGWIKVDEFLRASDRIYAVGDINARTMLAHAAENQAHYAVKHIKGLTDKAYDDSACPACIYGSPETLRVGKMGPQLLEEGVEAEVSRFNLVANPIAHAYASTQGFVKVYWVDGRIVGVTAVGHHVTSMATLATVMVKQGWTLEDVEELIFPHPSIDEALLEATRAPRAAVK